MKTSITSLKSITAVVVFFLVAMILNALSAKAQCGFSLGVLDSTGKLTITAGAGGTTVVPVIITNTSKSSFDVWVDATSDLTPFFFVSDSIISALASGHSATFHVTFDPPSTANGTASGTLNVYNAATYCLTKIKLIGIIKPNLCLETEHELSYKDPVLIGATAVHEFRLINQSGSNISISSVDLADSLTSGFRITSPLPLTVPPFSNDHFLAYTFSPVSNFGGTFFNTTFGTINLSGDSIACSSVTVLLIGNVAKPGGGSGIDTNIRPLFPTEARTLAIEGTGKSDTMTFTFTNNLSVTTTVNKVYLKDGTFFSVVRTDPTPTPFTLSPDQSMTVTISFNATDHAIHTDSLMIDASHNLLTTAFVLQGVQLAPSSVSPVLPQGVAIAVLPNPASSYVSVNMTGVRSADIQVFDLLGREVASAKVNSFWKWDASETPGGSYIVRFAGESMSGERFITSKRMILSR